MRQRLIRSIILSVALVYYLRLPTEEDRQQQNLAEPTREEFSRDMSRILPNSGSAVQSEMMAYITTENFLFPPGVALNQAVIVHVFVIVVSVATKIPLCTIGAPGQSKTLSFQIVLQNLQGSQLSLKQFCQKLPAGDAFFYLGSKYSRPEDIVAVFERAIKRERHYEQNQINTRCVVFLGETSLPDEKKMVLKVLHPYLDECKVVFVAVSNKLFDAANANRRKCSV
ncbi:unnamed protein product [Didymodactylos carnosus]|uniref:Uncharacterized protein n=1 Tax=Didymodactylos carnosus TaxID=1234261 RepID=A0A815WBP5_9BILA|nr:unnamed protein product [Didymodactylos carnosus]CAF1546559.1 unnamed protein product [Didymodactylos carnosus]CAF4228137.1 unnamed protein product [Didymodactylos carnosus]CAF4407368.1 unnamed protein product [Didymodactylos carnosus]